MSYIGDTSNLSSVFGSAADDVDFDHVMDAEDDDALIEAVENLGVGDTSMGDSQGENDKDVDDIHDELQGAGYDGEIENGLDIESGIGLDLDLGDYDDNDADSDLTDIEGATTAAAAAGAEQIDSREPSDDPLDECGDTDGMDLVDNDDTESFTDNDADPDFDLDDEFELDEGADCSDGDDDASSDDEPVDLEEAYRQFSEACGSSDDSSDDDSPAPDDEPVDLEEAYRQFSEASEVEDEDVEDADIEIVEGDDDGPLSDAELNDLVNAGGDDEIIDELE